MTEISDEREEAVARAIVMDGWVTPSVYTDEQFFEACKESRPDDWRRSIRHARAAIAAAYAETWEPIATAPRDGFFLVFGLVEVEEIRPRYAVLNGMLLHIAREGNAPEHLRAGWATHWRPLPTPPAAKETT